MSNVVFHSRVLHVCATFDYLSTRHFDATLQRDKYIGLLSTSLCELTVRTPGAVDKGPSRFLDGCRPQRRLYQALVSLYAESIDCNRIKSPFRE